MNRIELTNFRVFQDKTSFDLAPITILTGRNSSGKSSLIKAFILLADFLGSEESQLQLDLNGERATKHKINKFENLKNWFENEEEVVLSYEVEDYIFSITFRVFVEDNFSELDSLHVHLKPLNDTLVLDNAYGAFELTVTQNFIDFTTKGTAEKDILKDQAEYLKEFKTIKEDLKRLSSHLHSNNSFQSADKDSLADESMLQIIEQRHRLENRMTLLKSIINPNYFKEKGINFHSEIDISSLHRPTISNMIKAGLLKYVDIHTSYKFTNKEERRYLLDFAEKIEHSMAFTSYHLGPNRTVQSRLYTNDNNGSEINKIVTDYVKNEPLPGSEAGIFLQDWLKAFEIGDQLLVEQIEGIATKVEVRQNGRYINLADLGFGAGQLLTILMHVTAIIEKKLFDPDKSETILILIEEPEANLHPKLQSKLAEFFVSAALKYNLQFILETHSEYLIRKLQLLVAKDRIKPEEAIIYYLDCDAKSNDSNSSVTVFGGSQISEDSTVQEEQVSYHKISSCIAKKIEFLLDGKLSNSFGSGFFDEADEQALQLHRFQRKNQLEK